MITDGPVSCTIIRRSGHHTKQYHVLLARPPETYKQGDKLTVEIDGREIPVVVEIEVGSITDKLYVA